MKTLSNYISEKLIINKNYKKCDLNDLISKLNNIDINVRKQLDFDRTIGFEINKKYNDIEINYIWDSLKDLGTKIDPKKAYDDILNGKSLLVYTEKNKNYYAAIEIIIKTPINIIYNTYPFFVICFLIKEDCLSRINAALFMSMNHIEDRITKAYEITDLDSVKDLFEFLLKNNESEYSCRPYSIYDFEKLINEIQ